MKENEKLEEVMDEQIPETALEELTDGKGEDDE